MWRMVLAGCMAILVLAAAVYAADPPKVGGNVVPWKAGGGDAQPAGDGASVNLKETLTPALYARLIKPIEAKQGAIAKTQEAYDKEMEKPVDKRDERRLVALKQSMATAHLGAALAAKQSVARAREDNIMGAIKAQYQDPHQQQAISIFDELARKAYELGDVRTAVALYKRILQVDNENADAKAALEKIAQDIKSGNVPGQPGGSRGGGSDDHNPRSWERDKDYSGTKGKHYDDGRPNY